MPMDMAEAITQVININAAKHAHRAGCMCPKCKGMRTDKVKGKITTRKIKIDKPASKKKFEEKVKGLHDKQVINLDPKKKKSVEAKKFSSKERSKLADKGVAEPDGSYPIRNAQDLANARKDLARSSDPTAADRAHIAKRAKAIEGGGPGSGRHSSGGKSKLPSHFMGDKNAKGLQDMHEQLRSQGYKHKFSTAVDGSKGTTAHLYQKRDKSGTGMLHTRVIKERANGEHSLETRPSV